MKLASNCYSCIMDRAKFECDMLFSDDEKKMAAMEELLDFMVAHKKDPSPVIGTERERIMKRHSKNLDPYKEMKKESDRVACGLLPATEEFYNRSQNKLEALIRIAAAANSMEWGVKDHDFDNNSFGEVFQETLNERLDGDPKDANKYFDRFDKILYLTDNAGEVIFDLFVIEKLEKMGKRIVISPKSEPILNDVTADELRGMTDRPIEPSGSVIGLMLEEARPELLDILCDEDWLILAKGMGNFETITEFEDKLKGRLIYIMRAKCEPVANRIGTQKGSLVIRAV